METDGNAYLLQQILDAQRLGNEIAYQQLRLANDQSYGMINSVIMADLNQRLYQ